MNLNNLTVEGYTTFVLAIIFSIVNIAGFIYFSKHKSISTVLSVLIALVFPALAVLFWTYLILNLFGFTLLIALYISLGTAVGYVIVAFCVALIIKTILKNKANKKENKEEVSTEEEQKDVEEGTTETSEAKLLVAPEEPQPVVLDDEPETENIVDIEETTVEEEQPADEVIETEEEQISVEESIEEVPMEEEAPAEETTEDEDFSDSDDEDNENIITRQLSVNFVNGPKRPFVELLEEMDEEKRTYYNEVLEYALAKPKAKQVNTKFNIVVKIGSMRILFAKFVKETLVCKFMAGSSELKNYSKEEKDVKIKEKPVIIELTSEESVDAAKRMIDIVFKNILDAKEEKKAAKRAKKEQENQTEETSETEE